MGKLQSLLISLSALHHRDKSYFHHYLPLTISVANEIIRSVSFGTTAWLLLVGPLQSMMRWSKNFWVPDPSTKGIGSCLLLPTLRTQSWSMTHFILPSLMMWPERYMGAVSCLLGVHSVDLHYSHLCFFTSSNLLFKAFQQRVLLED